MTGAIEKIELSESQLEPCRSVPEPLHLVWSLTTFISNDKKNFRSSVKEFSVSRKECFTL